MSPNSPDQRENHQEPVPVQSPSLKAPNGKIGGVSPEHPEVIVLSDLEEHLQEAFHQLYEHLKESERHGFFDDILKTTSLLPILRAVLSQPQTQPDHLENKAIVLQIATELKSDVALAALTDFISEQSFIGSATTSPVTILGEFVRRGERLIARSVPPTIEESAAQRGELQFAGIPLVLEESQRFNSASQLLPLSDLIPLEMSTAFSLYSAVIAHLQADITRAQDAAGKQLLETEALLAKQAETLSKPDISDTEKERVLRNYSANHEVLEEQRLFSERLNDEKRRIADETQIVGAVSSLSASLFNRHEVLDNQVLLRQGEPRPNKQEIFVIEGSLKVTTSDGSYFVLNKGEYLGNLAGIGNASVAQVKAIGASVVATIPWMESPTRQDVRALIPRPAWQDVEQHQIRAQKCGIELFLYNEPSHTSGGGGVHSGRVNRNGISGDFFFTHTYKENDEPILLIFHCDGPGKGLAASRQGPLPLGDLFTGEKFRAVLETQDPAQILERAIIHLTKKLGSNSIPTMPAVCAKINVRTGAVILSNAGNDAPLTITADSVEEIPGNEGTLSTFLADDKANIYSDRPLATDFTCIHFELKPNGDILAIFSDYLSDALVDPNVSLQLPEAVNRLLVDRSSLKSIADQLNEAEKNHGGDDATLLLLRRLTMNVEAVV